MPYELMYVVRPNVDETSLTAVTEKVDRMITAGGGEILKREDWGKRRMAFPVTKFTEGYYSVLQFNLPPAGVRDLERALKLAEEVLRFLVTRVESA